MGLQLFAPLVLGLGEADTPISEDKSGSKDFPKLPSATSFIRNMLGVIWRLLVYI